MANTIIIGAGIGGLAAAIRMAAGGDQVTVLERHAHLGGKIRTLPSPAGPVAAGPTVMTMAHVFEELFADAGAQLSDWVTLSPEPILARHAWSDGTVLDLHAEPALSEAEISAVFGTQAAADFRAFSARARRLFDAFDAPMMQAAEPRQFDLTRRVLSRPRLIADMAPHRTLAGMLKGAFREPKLAQLFGRYATYVGGSPYAAPALLGLIADSEARGVWAVKGGMAALANALARFAETLGVQFETGAHVERIAVLGGKVSGVVVDGVTRPADTVLFNGDPRALARGALGAAVQSAVSAKPLEARSLSAFVLSFAGQPKGAALAHHTVFFGDNPREEFDRIALGQVPNDPTLYICAEDRAGGQTPSGQERFEIIMNGAPGNAPDSPEERERCLTRIIRRLEVMGLEFDPPPTTASLTTPAGFAGLFPMSQGSLYGQSPHGLTAGLKRPRARTAIPGLYLVGGGAHPGAGVPMAVLSARHAAEMIATDRISTSPSRQTDTRGGMSTGSATTAPARSASSPS